MKYLATHLTPFLASPPQNLRVLLPDGAPLSTNLPARNPSAFRSLLFSTTYKLPPPIHRFASPAFSCTYKLRFQQLPCFQKHLRCPPVFFTNLQISRAPPKAPSVFSFFRSKLSTFNCRLSTAIGPAIVTPSSSHQRQPCTSSA